MRNEPGLVASRNEVELQACERPQQVEAALAGAPVLRRL
jgi:hypothetical protein